MKKTLKAECQHYTVVSLTAMPYPLKGATKRAVRKASPLGDKRGERWYLILNKTPDKR
jgi:hypothetical protein